MKHRNIALLFMFLFLISCHDKVNQKEASGELERYKPNYAHFFDIEYHTDYKKISIYSPWDNEQLSFSYILPYDSVPKEKHQKAGDFVVETKDPALVVLSAPIAGALCLLELDSLIVGLTDPQFIYDSDLHQSIENKEIKNVGKNIQLQMETLIALQPTLIFGSGWDRLSADYQQLISLAYVPVLMYDWQEYHPLGKAEWLVFVAAFFNEEEKAISQFKQIEKSYLSLAESEKQVHKPLVLNGSEYQGIWYSAGGQSYMSLLYAHAGGDYILKADSSKGSVSLDFEVVLQDASRAQVWMYTGGLDDYSMQALQGEKYQYFKALQKGNVFSYHKRITDYGANDYWESATWQPHVVLQDLVHIFHGDDSADTLLYYFNRVEREHR